MNKNENGKIKNVLHPWFKFKNFHPIILKFYTDCKIISV